MLHIRTLRPTSNAPMPALTLAVRLAAVLCAVLCLAAPEATAQRTYPVYVSASLTPPYSPRLSDYCSPGRPALMVAVTANDLNIADLPVKLHIKLESVGVAVETPLTLRTPPIYLQGGATQLLWGDDLADYFNPANLVFKGYSKEAYTKSGQLPEGLYRFTVEVLHYHTNRPISNSGSATAWVAVGKPPVLLSPAHGAQTGQYPGMPLTFSWQASNVGIPAAAGQTSYLFELWEMRVPGIAPATVAASMPARHAEATQSTLLNVYPAQLDLEPGLAYAWRVTASDPAGNVPFEQEGRSQVRSFTYKALCDTVHALVGTAKGRNAEFCWEPAAGHTSFEVELRRPDNGWSTQGEAYDARAAFYDLEPGVRYELRVKGICNADPANSAGFSQWAAVTVPVPRPVTDTVGCPTCGCDNAAPLPEITNFELRTDLAPGDTITSHSGTTRFIIKNAQPDGNGAYSGVFLYWAEIWGVKVPCKYWDLKVNTDNVAVTIEFESVYDPKFLADVDAVADYLDKLADAAALLATNTTVKDTLAVALPFDYLYVDAQGNVVAVKAGPDGLPADTAVVGKANQLGRTLVTGPDGQEYVVANNGQVMGVNEYKATGGIGRLLNDYLKEKEARQASASPSAAFGASPNQLYGFDAYAPIKQAIGPQYPSLGNGYRPPFKSVASFAADRVAVTAPQGTSFRDALGMPLPAPDGSLAVRGGPAGHATAVYAYRALTDSTEEIIGKLNLLSFDVRPKRLVVVPVNGYKFPENYTAHLQQTLNAVYAQAVARWSVAPGDPLMVAFPDGTMDHGGSSALAAYNADQRLVINTFADQQGGLDNDALYLFFIDNVRGKEGIAGFMPLQRQCGFIYGSPNLNIVAHELGHGAFNLYHTFSPENYIAPEQSTDNLMDYKGGAELWKYQWDLVHDPETILLGFMQDEREGAAFGENGTKFLCINDANALAKLAKYQTLYLPDGKKADLKGKYTASGFYLADDVTQSARGAIYSLRINGYDNVQLFNKAKETKAFGYRVTDSTAVRSVTADALKADDDAVAYRVFIEKGNGNNGKITVKNGNETVETIDFAGDCNCNYHEKAEEVYFKTNSIAQAYVDYFQSRSLKIDQAIDKDNALIDQLVDAINRQKSAGLQDELLGNVLADKLRSYEKFNDRKFYVAVVPQNTLCLNQKAWNRLADAVFLKANLPDNAILITLPYVQCAGIGRDKGEFFFMPGLTFGGNIRIDLSGLAKSYQNTQNSAAFIADNTSSPMWTFVKDVFANTDKQYIRRYYYITAKGEIIGRSETAASHVGFPGTVDFRLMVDTRFFEYAKLLTESERYLDSKNLANNAHVIAAFNKRRLELNIALSNFFINHAEPKDSVVVHGMNEYTGTSDETNCARFALWYRDRFYSPGTKQGSPGDDCFYAGRNMVVYNENIANIDALGLMLSPFGFDWVADAIGCVYAGYYCDFGNSAMYGLGIAVPVVSIVYVKGSAKALLSGLRRGQSELVQEGSGYAIRWISRQADGLDDLLRRLNSPDLEDAFKADFSNFTEATRKTFLERPELVESWKVLFKEGDEISAAVRANTANLEKLDAFIKAEGADVAKLKSSFANAKDAQKWIDMKIPQSELDAAYDAMKNSPLDELTPWTKEHKAQRWANHKSGDPDADFNTWSNKYDGNIKKADAANAGVDDYYNSLGWNCTSCKEVTTSDITIMTDDGLQTLSRRHDIADKSPGVKKAIEVKEYSSGKVYYSEKSIKTQVALDAELLDSKEFLSIEWVFKGCEPSKPLEDALIAAGVTIKKIP